MQASHLQQLVDLEDSYWWHVAKRQLVRNLLQKYAPAPGKLVEGGIGSGRNLLEFREMGYDVSGFDLMPESVEHVRGRGIADARRVADRRAGAPARTSPVPLRMPMAFTRASASR